MCGQVDSATCATWVAALGTVIAAIGTIAAVAVTVRQNRDFHRQRQQELEVEQAKRVFVRFTSDSRESQAIVVNPSAEPIYDVTVWFENHMQSMGDTIRMRLGGNAIRPSGDHSFPIGGLGTAWFGSAIAVTFRDNAGLWWRKTLDGTLTKLPGKPDNEGA